MPVINPSGGGGGGVGAVLFDSTLGANAASIDTGAGGIAGSANVLEIWLVTRTDDAAIRGVVIVTFNNDTGANYDREAVTGLNVTPSAGPANAAANLALNSKGAGGAVGYPAVHRLTIPSYAATTFPKVGELTESTIDAAAATDGGGVWGFGYRPTAAISRMKVAVGGAGTVLVAGSRLLIRGV